VRIEDIYHPALSDRPVRRTVSRVPLTVRRVDDAVVRALYRAAAVRSSADRGEFSSSL
jgi:hypothetical protein